MKSNLHARLLEWFILDSKHLHTNPHVKHAPSAHRRVRTSIHTFHAMANTDDWKSSKKNAHDAALRQFNDAQNRFRRDLISLVRKFKTKTLSRYKFERDAKIVFSTAYTTAYRLGLKSSGLTALDTDRKTKANGPAIDPNDQAWIKSALQHERRFWNAFIDDVESERQGRYSHEERVKMYSDTLESVFNSGRVVGMPLHAIIYWVMDEQAENCGGCQLLRDNSPYTRETLPTTPRAGATPCIYNCKCKLRIAIPKSIEQWQATKAKRNRDAIARKLQRLKNGTIKYTRS